MLPDFEASRDIAGGTAQVGAGFIERSFQCAGAIHRSKGGSNAVLVHHSAIGGETTTQRNDWNAISLGQPGHTDRGFAPDTLAVDPAFAGNHQIGIA